MTELDIAAYNRMHQRGAALETAKAVFAAAADDLVALSYDQRGKIVETLKKIPHRTPQDTKQKLCDAQTIIFGSISYPQALVEGDICKVSALPNNIERQLSKAETAVQSGNIVSIIQATKNMTPAIAEAILGRGPARILSVNDKSIIKNSGNGNYTIAASFYGGAKPQIIFNRSAVFKRDYYQSGHGIAKLNVHELGHFEQYLNFLDFTLGSLFYRLIDPAGRKFITFGDKNYIQPWVHKPLYLCNPKERQSRYREAIYDALVKGETLKPEWQYFKDYLTPHISPRVQRKMADIFPKLG